MEANKLHVESADKQYLDIVGNILSQKFVSKPIKNRTKNDIYKIPHAIMSFDLGKQFPILTTKKVYWKTAVKEMLWIYQDQSNDVMLLQKKYNVKVWNEWMDKNGTIGESYGYIVKHYKQIDKLINTLINNPQDRRMMVDLWQIPHMEKCSLPPCCFLTMWDVSGDNRLNCMLVQRSGDMPLGVPFNMVQFAVLVHMIAQVTNLKPGTFTHVINNAHIYMNQVKGMELQLRRKPNEYKTPKLILNKEIKNFYDFTFDDIELVNYNHSGKIEMPISV